MDPRQVLGVGTKASRQEIRRAHGRLRALVDPRKGGTRGLAAIVDTAAEQLLGRAGVRAPSLDPHAVLGVGDAASVADIKKSYRRLVARVHPDRGGTDELFRIVDTAYDVLTRPDDSVLRRRTSATSSSVWSRPRPKDQPFRAPPADARTHPSKPRAWGWLALSVGLLMATVGFGGLVTVVLSHTASVPPGYVPAITVMPQLLLFIMVGARAVRSMGRAWTRAIGNFTGPSGAEPERFLAECCFDSPVHREHEERLYQAYVRWCDRRDKAGVSPWVFIEQLRSMGLLHVRAAGMDHGVWIGVRLRPDAAMR